VSAVIKKDFMLDDETVKPLLSLHQISKHYGHVRALENVDFSLAFNEVHAIVGDNGAGKSTMIKVMAGAVLPDVGEMKFDGQPIQIRNPQDSSNHGITTVFQHLALVDTRDVLSNLFLGREPTNWGWVDRQKMRDDASRVLGELSIKIPSLSEPVANLSGGQRQAVAIGRALLQGSKVIIMDEPTAALGVEETRKVLLVIEQLREKGLSVIVVSHNMHHVFSMADRITVMRGGRRIATVKRSETTGDAVVGLITGTELIDRAI
jgi:ABC-type sugar transport system ATPase subunit